MNFTTKDWIASIDSMPVAPSTLSVSGVIVFPDSGYIPRLILSVYQDRSPTLRLDLTVELGSGGALTVVTGKPVQYNAQGINASSVDIYYEGKLLHHIENISRTC